MSAKAQAARLALGALLGAISAVLGTVFHQAWIQGFPYGLLLSFGVLTWALLELRKHRSRSAAWMATATLALMIFWFALAGTDVMIPANFAGITWSYGSITWAVLVTAFPRISRY